jgi:hypothetical protein
MDFNQERLDSVINRFKKVTKVRVNGDLFTARVQMPSGIAGMATQPYVELKPYRSRRGKTFLMTMDLLTRWKVAENQLHYLRQNIVTHATDWVLAEVV